MNRESSDFFVRQREGEIQLDRAAGETTGNSGCRNQAAVAFGGIQQLSFGLKFLGGLGDPSPNGGLPSVVVVFVVDVSIFGEASRCFVDSPSIGGGEVLADRLRKRNG